MTVWVLLKEAAPSVRQVANAERAYAANKRTLARQLQDVDEYFAAELRLEADLCELWAEEVESGSDTGRAEYDAAVREWRDAMAGRCAPRGGVRWLLKTAEAGGSAHVHSEAIL